jgi:hypothetical protein
MSALVGFVTVFRCVTFHKLEWSVFNCEFSLQWHIGTWTYLWFGVRGEHNFSETGHISFLRWNGRGKFIFRRICPGDQ